MTDERTKGSPPFLFRRDHPKLITPPQLPRSFLYMGAIVNTNIAIVDAMIFQRGIRVVHTHSVACPCVLEERFGGGGVPNPICVDCRGLGIAFPGEGTEVRALVSDATAQEQGTQGGSLVHGPLKVTFESGYVASVGDRLVMPDMITPIAKMWKYRADVGGIRLPFAVEDIEVLTAKYPDPEEPLFHLVLGRDFTIDKDNRVLVFPEGSRVTDGMVVSGAFMAVPDYIITQVYKANRGMMSGLDDDADFVRLPIFVEAQRADILIGQQRSESSGDGSVHGQG